MYACIHETGCGFLAGGVEVRGSATYFSRPTPTLAIANGSMPAPYPVIITAANLYSLPYLLCPGNKRQSTAIELFCLLSLGLCRIVDTEFREHTTPEVPRTLLPRTPVNRPSPEMRQASWAGNISVVLRPFLKWKRGLGGKGEDKRVRR
jgi:hypothetical protein